VSDLPADVTVGAAVLERVVERAREAAPDECCGLLIGSAGHVVEAVSAHNIAEHPRTRFLIDPRDHVSALREARRRGLDVVGFYHSHPRSAATPSETDVAEATYPDFLSLIVGFGPEGPSGPQGPEVRLYRFSGGTFLPVRFARQPVEPVTLP
jgi:proteasome lid subunit RPN8/RPN11